MINKEHQAKMIFSGVGNSHSVELKNSSATFIYGDVELCIDFGVTTYNDIKNTIGKLPSAIFITHCHLDHIGGLENLFYDVAFKTHEKIKLFVPSVFVDLLHRRMTLPNMAAEGGMNFWDVFQLIPVSDYFWLGGLRFQVFENRHHYIGFSYGLSLPGKFLFSGDTKPIPEVVTSLASQGEIIFHDASASIQPSHSYLNEILQSYSENYRERMWLYHLANKDSQKVAKEMGFQVVEPVTEIIL